MTWILGTPICMIVGVLIACCSASANEYSIVDKVISPIPWQNAITLFNGQCSGDSLMMLNSSGGSWSFKNQTGALVFTEQQVPYHELAAKDVVSGQFYFFRSDTVFHSTGLSTSPDFVVKENNATWMYAWDGEVVICGKSRITLVSNAGGLQVIDFQDTLGVVALHGSVYYANVNGVLCRVNLKSRVIEQLQTIQNEVLIGAMDSLIVVRREDELRLVHGNAYVDSVEGVPVYSNYSCGWIGTKLVVVGSNNSIINHVYSVDFESDVVQYLGNISAQRMHVVTNKACNKVWAVGYPVTITEFVDNNGKVERGTTRINSESYVQYVDYHKATELLAVIEATAPELKTGVGEVFAKVFVSTESGVARTKCSVPKLKGEYVQSAYSIVDSTVILTTNLRVLSMGDVVETLIESDDIITASSMVSGDLIYATTKGLYRRTNSGVELLQSVTADSFVVVGIECSTDNVLIIESRMKPEPTKRFSILRNGHIDTLIVENPSLYGLFYMSGDQALFIARRIVGPSIIDTLAFGSILNRSFIRSSTDGLMSALVLEHQIGDTLVGFVYQWNIAQILMDSRMQVWEKPNNAWFINHFSTVSRIKNSRIWAVVNSTLPAQLVCLELTMPSLADNEPSVTEENRSAELKSNVDGWSMWVGDQKVAADFSVTDYTGRLIISRSNVKSLSSRLIPKNQVLLIYATDGINWSVKRVVSVE